MSTPGADRATVSTEAPDPGTGGLGRRIGVFGRDYWGSVASVLFILAAWELLARSGRFPSVLLPTVASTFDTFWELLLTGTLWTNTTATLGRMLLGYAIAVVIGIVFGLLMARFSVAEELGLPLLAFLLPIPSLALVPLFTIWFGLGGTATLVLVIVASTLPVALNTWNGARTVDRVYMRAAKAMNIDGFALYRKVMLPAALPSMLTGLRYGLSVAWRAVIAGELISVTGAGLGWMIFNARYYLRADVMLSALVVIAVLGIVIERVTFTTLQRYTVERWGLVPRTRS